MPKIGTKVFAVKSSDKEKVYLYGIGIYLGNISRPKHMRIFTEETIKDTFNEKN